MSARLMLVHHTSGYVGRTPSGLGKATRLNVRSAQRSAIREHDRIETD